LLDQEPHDFSRGSMSVFGWENSKIDIMLPKISIQSTINIMNGQWVNIATVFATNGINAFSTNATNNAFFRICVTNIQN